MTLVLSAVSNSHEFTSYCCGLLYTDKSLTQAPRPVPARSKVARYENDLSSLLLKCTSRNFEEVRAGIHSQENPGNEVLTLMFTTALFTNM